MAVSAMSLNELKIKKPPELLEIAQQMGIGRSTVYKLLKNKSSVDH